MDTEEVAYVMLDDDDVEHILDVLGVRALKSHLLLDRSEAIIPGRNGHLG